MGPCSSDLRTSHTFHAGLLVALLRLCLPRSLTLDILAIFTTRKVVS